MNQLGDKEIRILLGELEILKASLLARLRAKDDTHPHPHAGDSQEERLLDASEVATRYGLRKGRILELARQGHLPAVRIGKYVRFRLSTVREFMERQEGH